MTKSAAAKVQPEAQDVIPFVTEVAQYFMDFLETDFHKTRSPKRFIQTRNSSNLQVSINLGKYKKYGPLVWKVIRKGFDDDSLNDLKRGVHTNQIPPSLLKLIQAQIEEIEPESIEGLLKLFRNEIDLAVSKHPDDTPLAITFALDGIARVIREKFLVSFVKRIREPLDKLKTASVDSIFQIDEELTAVLIQSFEDVVSSIVNQTALRKEINAEKMLGQVFEIKDVRNKLESFFKGFAAGDLFLEVAELVNNKNLIEKQEFYLYFCDISYKNQSYPLFYVPLHVEKSTEGLALNFDSRLFVNKKAIRYISEDFNTAIERKGSLSAFLDRIIYLSEEGPHLIAKIDFALKEAVNYFGLNPYLDIHDPSYQVAKGQGLQITNSCYFGLFDRSDESLVNDYEEILQKLKEGGGNLTAAFQLLIDDFITNNPVSVISKVDQEWDDTSSSDKLVYTSPVPLNEEQRQILAAIAKPDCKYVTVEGPPGTGKSHTITAIVCDAILKNQSVLVLSDKKEALDVVEDKITETMNKVRLDKHFQNPLLRLGRAGNTYSKILSNASMDRIKEQFRAVRGSYDQLESSITDSVLGLKTQIQNSVEAYRRIKRSEISEFIKLEEEITSVADLPVDLEELLADPLSDSNISNLRNEMLELRSELLDQEEILEKLFKTYYPSDRSVKSFRNFLAFMNIVNDLRIKANNHLPFLAMFHDVTTEGMDALEQYVALCEKLKSPITGFFFKGDKVAACNRDLAAMLPNYIAEPHKCLKALKYVVSLFTQAQQLKIAQEVSGEFEFKADFVASVHQLLTLQVVLPSWEECKELAATITSVEILLKQYKKTASKLGVNSKKFASFTQNAFTKYPDEEFEKLIRYLCLRNDLQDHFSKIPKDNYIAGKEVVEELVTTQMTYKMDNRVVDFYENHRNDAKTLAGVITKKKRFDKASFEKLKNSFPCILAGIRDFAEYIPLESEIFNLVILDEASQVSIAQAFPALLRGEKIIVLGDKKQFSNVKSAQARSDTNREYLNKLREVFVDTISSESSKLERLEKFNVKTSILDFFERISNYNITLKKHFRGYREIISYSSKYFYSDSLQAIKIRAKPIDEVIKFSLVEHDGRLETIENSNLPEVEAIIAEVERISKEEPASSIGIITPHTNQQKLLVDAFSKHPKNEHFQKEHKLKIMTFDTCQGEERDIILYSMVANAASDKLWGVFIKDRSTVDLEEGGQIKLQRLNVGFSRAKERMHFFFSKPLEDYTGSIGEALQHYRRTLEEAHVLPEPGSTDPRSPMEAKVLHWIQETSFFKSNARSVEIHPQFPLGDYIKQLDKRYTHPAYVVDFLFVYSAEGRDHKIVIEYDGFESHFEDHASVNDLNHDRYHTEKHVYREKVLESYGYKFLRINRFNVGKDPVDTLNRRLEELVKKKDQSNHALVATIHHNVDGLKSGRMKECPQCKTIMPLENFKSSKLTSGYGRHCNPCMGRGNEIPTKTKQNVRCPDCKSPMILRERRRDKRPFYGCVLWPKCTGTRPGSYVEKT